MIVCTLLKKKLEQNTKIFQKFVKVNMEEKQLVAIIGNIMN